MTLRDEVWNAVLKQLVKTASFRIGDLPFTESQRHTVRRVLRTMEEMGWLQRRDKRAATWCAGEKAKLHLNISADRLNQAEQNLNSLADD